jgi:DNA-binding IclR family transcriptional regulator
LRIEDERLKTLLVKILNDESCRRILAFSTRPVSVAELSSKLNIPLSSTYRCVKTLMDAGLLLAVGSVLTDEGKKYNLYQTAVTAIDIHFSDGNLQVELTPRMDLTHQFTKLLKSLREGM